MQWTKYERFVTNIWNYFLLSIGSFLESWNRKSSVTVTAAKRWMAGRKTEKRQSKKVITVLMLMTLLAICIIKVIIVKGNWVDDVNRWNMCNNNTHENCSSEAACETTGKDCALGATDIGMIDITSVNLKFSMESI